MSTMLCAWAHVDDAVHEEYASHIAEAAAQLSTRAWHFEAEKDPVLEFENASQHNVLTIFENVKRNGTDGLKERSNLLSGLTNGACKNVRIDTCPYEEIVSFNAEGYMGEFSDLEFLVVAKLHLRDEAISKDYFDWTQCELMPNLLKSPEFLRARYFKAVDGGTVKNGVQSQEEEGKNTLCFYELDSDDWLWDAFTHISESNRWRKMEASLELEMRKWFLKNCYSNSGKPSNAKQ